MSEHELTLTATGQARTVTATDTDEMAVRESVTREVTADIDLDADRLYNSDIATTHKSGVAIVDSDVAELVCETIESNPVDPQEWNVVVSASLDDWQKVALGAAKQRQRFESGRVDTAIHALLTLHERYAETDRPLYAALNIDETYDGGRREEILDHLTEDQAATAEAEVTADA